MTITRSRTLFALAAGLAGVLLMACGGDDNDGGGGAANDAFFVLATADETAHAALIDDMDLPGAGWEVTQRDEPEDDDSDDSESGPTFDSIAMEEPACSQIVGLSNIGGIFGSSDGDEGADDRVARAQIEIERATEAAVVPTSVEVEIEIENTVADVQGGWTIVKELLGSDRTQDCIANVVNTMFSEEFADAGIELTLTPQDASASTPQDGVSMAFLMAMTLQEVISVDLTMEMHFWPYGNGKVTVLLLGADDDLTSDLVDDLLMAVDAKIVAAEAAQ